MKAKTVLIIEPDESQRRQMASLLAARGAEALEAVDVETGRDLARKRRPDLLLMELKLFSNGLDEAGGWGSLPRLALTSGVNGPEPRKALESGFDGYIAKPVEPRAFLKTVARYLANGHGSGGPEDEALPVPRKVLVIDSAENGRSVEEVLAGHGYRTARLDEGARTVDNVLREAPDLVLLDLKGPAGDGAGLARGLKQDSRTRDIPIVLITDLEDQEGRVAGLEAGAEEFLTRPVRTIELLARTRSALDLRAYRDRAAGRTAAPDAAAASTLSDSRLPVVLVVEGHARDLKAAQAILKGLHVRVETATSAEKALLFLHSERVDAVIVDLLLPDMDGLEVCRRTKEVPGLRDIPLVVTTVMEDVDSRARTAETGADAFFVKPLQDREFRGRMKTLLARKASRDELERRCEAALKSAVIDWTTGLHSSGFFRSSLGLEIRRSERHTYPVSLLVMDVDDFGALNETLGREGGDIVLQEIAQVVRNSIREVDLAARTGEDDFAVILPYCDKAGAFQAAQRIKQALAAHHFYFEAFDDSARVTLSEGIAMFPSDAGTGDDLERKARQMLGLAKKKGKNRICL
jgi:two-component system cell cycle response regulator